MKNILLPMLVLLSTLCFGNIDTLRPKSKITDVTVFFSGAEVTRTSKVNLTKGQHLLWIDELPQQINPQSIQVKSQAGLQILSVVHQLNYQDQAKKSKQEQLINDQIEAQKIKMKSTNNQIGVQEIEENILLKNSTVNQSERPMNVQEISSWSTFYQNRLNSIRQKKLDLMVKLKDQQEQLEEMYKNLNKLIVKKRQTYSQVLVRVECSQTKLYTIPVSYLVSTAGWEPLYDFRVSDINQPLKVVYQANIFQTSGEDWREVNMSLSSANPNLNGELPELKRFYLGEFEQSQRRTEFNGNASVTGRIFDSSNGDAIPFANITLIDNANSQVMGTTSDFDGLYTLKPIKPGTYTMKVTYVGYDATTERVSLSANNQLIRDFSLNSGIALSEVEIVEYKKPLVEKDRSRTRRRDEIQKMAVRSSANVLNTRGARSAGNVSFVDGVRVMPEVNLISNSVRNTVTDFQYDIKVPYTVLSDGETYNLRIKEEQLAVDYQYLAIPKLEQSVFLTAILDDWERLNLLSGQVSIYFEGTYKSSSFLNVQEAEDTLVLSLGRDRGINIERTQDLNQYDKKVFGKRVEETVEWKITTKSQKSLPIKLKIEDQYPLSKYEYMKVELGEVSEAKVDKKEGKLSWNIELKPGEKKEIRFGYTAEYPR